MYVFLLLLLLMTFMKEFINTRMHFFQICFSVTVPHTTGYDSFYLVLFLGAEHKHRVCLWILLLSAALVAPYAQSF